MTFTRFFFALLICCGSWAQADEMELIFYRAPQPLNWKTPQTLIKSTLKNMRHQVDDEDYPHTISHVNVRLQCGAEEPIYRGMTSDKSNISYAWDFFSRRESLDVLLLNVPGRFYTEREILRWLPKLKKRGYVRSLKIALNSEQCERGTRYLKLYSQLRLQKIYGGLRSDPRKGEGAGCSAFAMSVLEVLGLITPEMEMSWKRTLSLPESLITTQTHKAKTGVLGLARGKGRGWAKPGERQVKLNFWDPELMFNWVGKKAQRQELKSEADGKHLTVFWDAQSLRMNKEPLFPWSQAIMEKTVGYHRVHLGRSLTWEEVRDSREGKCRIFSPCY